MSIQETADRKRLEEVLKELPPEYMRKVKIYAETLLDIFTEKKKK